MSYEMNNREDHKRKLEIAQETRWGLKELGDGIGTGIFTAGLVVGVCWIIVTLIGLVS